MSKQSDLVNITQGDTITVDHASGNVGIGTTNLTANSIINELHVDAPYTNGLSRLRLSSSVESMEAIVGLSGYLGDDALYFSIGSSGDGSATERMRIDSSGNVLVGQSATDIPGVGNTTTGISLRGTEGLFSSRSSNTAAYFNRNGTDGEIVRFLKDGNGPGVGSIGVWGSDLTIGRNGTYIGFFSNGIAPASSTTSWIDNAKDLGSGSVRWDDVYATNGTIQTSDANEKQDIAELDEAEKRVAIAAKGLIRKYRWKDAVAEKGDDARIHVGIIAQDLQAAFAAEGLDAGRYAMFISSTWWEAERIIPAVEAKDAVLDEEGNVIEEAVEAQPEQTVVDTFDTLEEAPEGAVERTRLGVRYPELLAFIIGAM